MVVAPAVSVSAGILGRGRSGRFLVVRGPARARRPGPAGWLPRHGFLASLVGTGRSVFACFSPTTPSWFREAQRRTSFWRFWSPWFSAGGEQEGAQAPLLLRPAADDGDLSRLEHEVRRQVAEGLLLLAVVDPELLGGVRRGVGQGLVGSLDRAVMDLGGEPQRDAVAALVRRGDPEVAAGGLEILAVGPVVAVQEEARPARRGRRC